ncbi:right-handed parallel beta-helix repeat-containing protein [Chitinispirillales bacterium ANBcel5]|uniref:NosD domain-containing protein n=1 Tax=Cellulosispirillum alkaliphilum TaxID=3039283 RepID=UPI002A5819BE|nr:right-handed parallel beta-helix repeat-containing protein [Chitinispirillales bacterium ANBcel5]
MNHKSHFQYALLMCICFLFFAHADIVIVPSEGITSITEAMSVAKRGDTVLVKDGIYREEVQVNPGVILRAENQFKAVINGRGRGNVVTLSTGSVIIGFEIKNGTIGVFSSSSQAAILRNLIVNNQQSGILSVGHLPKIEDNVIAYNSGSGIQGWDVRTTSAVISHNTIAFNKNHGISLGGNSDISVEYNIIALNDQFGIRASDETVRIDLIGNNFFNNTKFTGTLPGDNVSHDPMFVDAQRMNFNLMSESKSIGLGKNHQNLGARLVN